MTQNCQMAQKLAPAEKIAQIYLQHLQLFASLIKNLSHVIFISKPRLSTRWQLGCFYVNGPPCRVHSYPATAGSLLGFSISGRGYFTRYSFIRASLIVEGAGGQQPAAASLSGGAMYHRGSAVYHRVYHSTSYLSQKTGFSAPRPELTKVSRYIEAAAAAALTGAECPL